MSMTGLTQEQLTKRRASKGKVNPNSRTPEQIMKAALRAAESAGRKTYQPVKHR